MTTLTIQQQILEDLERMSPELQRKAQEIVHDLAVAGARPKGTPGGDLLRFAGILVEAEARGMERVIEEGCEQVDLDGW